MAAAAPFVSKQAVKFDGTLLQELQGDVTDTIARDLLREDLPPIAPSSGIHDNGCGYGAVTTAIMESRSPPPPQDVQIHATDANPKFLSPLQAKLVEHLSWPVKLEPMDACHLTFPDNTFDLSLATFVFLALKDDDAVPAGRLREGGDGERDRSRGLERRAVRGRRPRGLNLGPVPT
ncbi:hypothetical protein Hte_006857 [Hypoxylon texense]